MRNSISSSAYAWASAVRFVLFFALILAVSVAFSTLAEITGGEIWRLSAIAAFLLGFCVKPLFYLGFAGSLARTSMRRAETVGMPGEIGIYIALLVMVDLPTVVLFGQHPSIAQSLGIGPLQPPYSLGSATIAIIVLTVLREPAGVSRKRHGTVYGIWFCLMMFLLSMGLSRLLLALWPLQFGLYGAGLRSSLKSALAYLDQLTLYPLLPLSLFIAASIALVWTSRNRTGRMPLHSAQRRSVK